MMDSEALPPISGFSEMDQLVYIVILNWNGREDTLACLRSLEPVWNERTKGIVVDNGSSDGTPDAVREAFTEVEVLEVGKNLGFTEGNNIGLRFALDRGADYVLLLNNDTIVDPGFLREMLPVATVSEEIGFVSPKIYFLDPPDLLWFAGAKFSTVTGYGHVIGYRKPDRGQYDDVQTIDRPCGCAVLVSRRLCREAGLMEDGLFLYADEIEWMLRARKHGFKARYAPKAKVWHKVSASVGRESHPDAFYYGVRNTLYALDTHVPCRIRIFRYFREISVTSVHLAALLLSSSPKVDGLRAIWQGLADNRRGIFGKRRNR
jgi:GT2 family glycosyltransferase